MQDEFQLIIAKNLPQFNNSLEGASQKKEFLSKLSKYFEGLLTNDFSALLQIMYRIDVPEKEFALTLSPSNNRKPSDAIAELVYDRLILKAKIRAKYKKKNA